MPPISNADQVLNPAYGKLLFVGSRGEYKGVPFEVLGFGFVDYQITAVGNLDDTDDIGQTFATVEYYCLANNGQTWYFAVSGEEVYYCRQLSSAEILGLNLENLDSTSQAQSLVSDVEELSLSSELQLQEAGTGQLRQAEGRALRDLRNNATFSYQDLQRGSNQQESYSVDVFPDGTREWFQTIRIPALELSTIFIKSLRLKDPKVDTTFRRVRFWAKTGIVSLVIGIGLLGVGSGLSIAKTTLWSKELTLVATLAKEVELGEFRIQQPNQIHTLEVQTELPAEYGLNLDLIFLNERRELVSSTTQEFSVYTTENSEGDDTTKNQQRFETTFFPVQAANYIQIVKINDFGKVGATASSAEIESKRQELEQAQNQIKILEDRWSGLSPGPQNITALDALNQAKATASTLEQSLNEVSESNPPEIQISSKVSRGGVFWPVWIFGCGLSLIVAGFSFNRRYELLKNIWKNE